MNEALRQRLNGMPRLQADGPTQEDVPCKVCGKPALLFDVVDLLKHCSTGNQYRFGTAGIPVVYHRCVDCGFLFTPFFDGWTREDCSRYIYNDDYILVDPEYASARAVRLAATMAKLLRGCEALRILDYGSGSGAFASAMREAGFGNVENYDPFSSPAAPGGVFDLVTCFEVLEHVFWPNQALRDILSYLKPDGCLIFSQSIQPPNIVEIRGAWWYLAPRNGHVSMFTPETLQRLLPSRDRVLHGNGWLWAFAPPQINPRLIPCIAAIGPAVITLTLRPPADGSDEFWHAGEVSPAGLFRWSRTASMTWRVGLESSGRTCLRLRIPYMLEIDSGFSVQCGVQVAGVTATVSVLSGEIVAEAVIDARPGDIAVTLTTPQVRSPFDIRGAPDARGLGLAALAA